MINPHRIKYAGISSDELNILDLIMCAAIDSDDGETNTYLNRSAVQSESYDGRYNPTARYKYDEVFAPKFTFFKKDFSDFSMEEVRILLKYLTSKDTTSLLEVYYDDSNVVTWAAIGGWTELNLQKLANNRTIGVTGVFSSIHPFALSDVYNVTQNVATVINTTMYYWASTFVSGVSVPQYLFTETQTPKVGTAVYATESAVTESVINVPMFLYGAISEVNEDGSYKVNNTTFKIALQGTKTKRSYNNKIVIDIDNDDNKAVYPRVTINHGYSGVPHTIVPVSPETEYTAISDMVPNTIYFNGTTYYWKAAGVTFSSIAPDYGWDIMRMSGDYNISDIKEANLVYYYEKADMYYWIDPYLFHKQTGGTPPVLSTTSVKFTNVHTDYFYQKSVHPSVIVKNNSSTEKIVLDGANKIISSSSTRRIFGDDFNWQWLELYDGRNEITIEGNCEVTLEWRTVMKCGEW